MARNIENFIKLILKTLATFFFVGKIKPAPGTWGSLAAFPLMYFILALALQYQWISGASEIEFLYGLLIFFTAVTVLLFVIGIISSSLYVKFYQLDNDPQEIVIDEVVGQMLTNLLCFWGSAILHKTALPKIIAPGALNFITIFLLPFILFRFFDITKPWPINYVDSKIKGGIGIMLDDVLAAIFASVIFYAIVLGVLRFYPIQLT